jgi:hypothetical protein
VLRTIEEMPLRIRTGPPMENLSLGRGVRELRVRLEAMESMQRRKPTAEDVSDAEREEI